MLHSVPNVLSLFHRYLAIYSLVLVDNPRFALARGAPCSYSLL